jgi:uncharacterized membrane protein
MKMSLTLSDNLKYSFKCGWIKGIHFNPGIFFWIIVILFLGFYTTQVVCNHLFFRTYALDYGLYNKVIWDYSHFRLGQITLMTPPIDNFFQDHITFTLFLILPLFWILNPLFGTNTLLIIQVLFIVLGGIGCYKFIQSKVEDKIIPLLALVHYFMLQGHYATLSADYHDVVIASSMITWYIYFFSKEKILPTVGIFVFIMLAKENMSLWLIFTTIALMIIQKKTRWTVRYGSGLIALGVVYFIITFAVLIPCFANPSRPYYTFRYNEFGDTPKEVFKYFLTHPLQVFGKLFYNHTGNEDGDWVKTEYYAYFLIGGGWLIFRRPALLLMLFPVLAQKMLNDTYYYWSLNGYFSVEIESIYTLMIFYVISGFSKRWTSYLFAALVTILTIVSTIHSTHTRYTVWYHEIKENVFSSKFYKPAFDYRAVRAALDMIPPDASVSASNTIVPHLAYRPEIYLFPEIRDAEYIVLLDDGNPYPLKMDRYLEMKEELIESGKWSRIYDKKPLNIFKRIEITHSSTE